MIKKEIKKQKGFLLWPVMMSVVIAILLLGGLLSWLANDINLTRRSLSQEKAFRIAEAGLDYYRWRLAHSPEDYLSTPGPLVQEFKDAEGNMVGYYELEIIPPPAGSSLITILSKGVSTYQDREVERIIEIKLGIPSLARYAVVANSTMRFGEGTEIFGVIHSNQGIRFDGVAHNLVTSAVADYYDPDHSGEKEFGVHTHISPLDPLPPVEAPWRSDVFKAGRKFPVPAIDFTGIIYDLANMKTKAQASGDYISPSGEYGYRIFLKEDNSYDLFKITSLISAPTQCSNTLNQDNWGTWSIASEGEEYLGNFPWPDDNLIFVEDDIWVEGQVDKAAITIAAARFPDAPSQRAHITVNNDLLYTNYDGQDAIALIAQENINTGWDSAGNLRIDAALIAQNGRIGRFYFRPPSWFYAYCGPNHIKEKITLYGMLITNGRYGFAYTDGTGYQIREIHYDSNFLYNPPPHFPSSADYHQIISWREI